ncbi:MAG: hypothetical protein WB492_06420, partial [Christiangramia sp.]
SRLLFKSVKKWITISLLGIWLSSLSCAKSDDLEIIENESSVSEEPTGNDSPPESESPPVNETPVEEESVIIYTDIEPDFIGKNINDSYALDLNNDKIVDFFIGNNLYENWDWLVISAVRNDGIISVEPWYTHTVPIESDREIFDPVPPSVGQHFARASIIAIEDCFENEDALGCSFDWAGKYDKYIGLRIKIKEQIHFGWVRMDVTNVTQWIIKDYAFNTTPNKRILTGQRE